MYKVSTMKKYYGKDFNDFLLLLDINESKESLLKKIADFTQHRGTSYVDFIDKEISEEDIVKSYQLLEMNINKGEEIRIFDVHDMYGEIPSLRNATLLEAVNLIYEDISSYKYVKSLVRDNDDMYR